MIKLPTELQQILDTSKMQLPKMGYSQDNVVLLYRGYKQKDVVLKYSCREEIKKEAMIYKWLQGKIAVPKVYFYKEIDHVHYLLMEMLPGNMGQDGFNQLGVEKMIMYYAKEIRKWHELDYTDFPNVNSLEDKINQVKYNVQNDQVKCEYFEEELKNKTPNQIYDMMIKCKIDTNDLVLCHGDVCFPNFMMKDGHLTGWIDVIGAGVNDRYLDLSIALRSLRYNLKLLNIEYTSKYQDIFLKAYGLSSLDKQKIKFFIYLDELTNN